MKFKALSNDKRKLDLNWDSINAYTHKWVPNTEFEVEIAKRQPRKSDPLRKYYYGGVLPTLMEHLGYEREETEIFHWHLKIVFFQIAPDERGIPRNVPHLFSNGSDVPVDQKAKYVDWVIRKAAENGCYIESPGEE